MAVQTDYNLYQRNAVEGMHATNADSEIATKAASETIAFGRAVVRGTNSENTRLPVDANSKFLGIAIRTIARENNCNSLKTTYVQGEEVPVLRRGTVWVKVETPVVAGDLAYFRVAGTGDKGAIRNNADTANAVRIPGGVFETAANANGLAILRIYGGAA